ncbi:hypothetical protein PDO_4239 [Rhizobium sp. PDO1-076]|uniref:hypothetical protein n=1 Tax=Rhizobium sp. PDO1-076 TaxID=1125979 RepID=UPI00024E354B|nr:hypothetical protein [Rhizobium sp. PDO1-076]EHS53449.1 hypothetical protein PDO_4239 [Rhizobium sp. PDO1-076]
MILEALNYAASWPLTAAAHRPYVRSSVNLWSRAHRCANHWAAHEANCKAAIISAIDGLRQRRTAVVLGSGLLRDIPVVELAKRFDTVVLVDLVHLASTRAWIAMKGLKNIRLIERDLSGFDQLATGRQPEPLSFLRQVPYLDFVVSANLLSQIGLGAKKRLETLPVGDMPADTLKTLISAHLDGLRDIAATACLLTDVAYSVVDRAGRTLETVDLLHGIEVSDPDARWDWPVVPFGEQSADIQVIHRVIARTRN